MRAYQECQSKDLNSNTLRKRKRKSSRIFFPVMIAVVVIGAASAWMLPVDAGAQLLPPSPPRASDKTEYWSKAIKMTDVPSKVENGKISIPLDVVK